MKVYELENKLFHEWEEHLKQRYSAEDVENKMCYDGLHFTGTPDKSSGYWLVKPDHKEEELWKSAKIRPLFLTKDYNLNGDSVGGDTREETGLDNDTDNVYHKFFARYLILLYGLTKIDIEKGIYPPFEEAQNQDNYLDNFYQAPVARMNLKKMSGAASCSEQELDDNINQDFDFIRRQMDLYHANVIVCCHSPYHNPILVMLKKMYPDMEQVKFGEEVSDFLYYSPASKVVILHEWHPSAWTISYERYYAAVPELCKFLNENPDAIV